MRKAGFFITLLLLTIYSCVVLGQGIGIGQWRDHLPYKKTISVAEAGDKVYCATPYSMFYYNKSDNSINRLSKINGLSDFGIRSIRYNETKDVLLVAYTNANIDLIYENQIINLPDIKRANLLGSKTINNILFIDELAYLSCGFGIVVLDLDKIEVKDTWFIGPDGTQININDLMVNDSSFFAATDNGIYTADKNDPNLANFENWSKFNQGPYPNAQVSHLENFSGYLFLNYLFNIGDSDTLYKFNGSEWSLVDTAHINDLNNIRVSEDQLVIAQHGGLLTYNQDLSLIYEVKSIPIAGSSKWISNRSNDAFIDRSGNIWSADEREGMVRIFDQASIGTLYQPVGPPSINSFDMAGAGEAIWVAPGGRTEVWSPVYNNEGVFTFYDEDWEDFKYPANPELQWFHDFITVSVDPLDPSHIIAGAFRASRGLAEFRNNQVVNIYDTTNSSLQYWVAANSIAVTGTDFDQHGNLWVANSGANNIVSVRKPDGSTDGNWESFNLGSTFSSIDIGSLITNRLDQKWIIKRKTIESPYFIIVFNENNSGSKVKGLTGSPGSGDVPGNKVYCLAEDQDGEIWIGSDDGISVIYSPENVFVQNADFDAQRIIIPRNDGTGLGDILLENEVITCLTIDGDNNKWIGTDNAGVFLLSPDGMEEIYHFTAENSPLFSNLITGIAINDDGEVFIGTSKGIISFRGESSPPQPELTNVYAYPNPVKQSYTGKIGIKGLVKNSDVKITDISGNLVYETRSQGGQAIWNGANFSGERVQSGVYLVFISNEDGSQTMVTKILFIN